MPTQREADCADLGPDYLLRRTATEAHVRRLVRQLEALGQKVIVERAA